MRLDLASPRDRLGFCLCVALLSLALLEVAAALTPSGSFLSFCPIGGVLLAAFVRAPRARWLEPLLGTLAAVIASALLIRDPEFPRALIHWALDAAAACGGALAVQRLSRRELSLGRLRGVTSFVSVAAGVTCAQAIAAAALVPEPGVSAGTAIRGVWSSDVLGFFAVAPALLTISDSSLRALAPRSGMRVELVGLLAGVVAATYATYYASAPLSLPRGFPALVLMWTAFRFGPRGSALGMALMTVTVLWAAASGELAALAAVDAQPHAVLWELQGFLSVSFVTVLVLAALSEERAVLIERLEGEVRVLRGLLPICSHCKKIRDDAGSWNPLETYLQRHTEATFTHGICPTCMAAHYGEVLEHER